MARCPGSVSRHHHCGMVVRITYPVVVVVIRYLLAFLASCCGHVALIAPAPG
jgi:hypothetical protein